MSPVGRYGLARLVRSQTGLHGVAGQASGTLTSISLAAMLKWVDSMMSQPSRLSALVPWVTTKERTNKRQRLDQVGRVCYHYIFVNKVVL